MKDMYHRWTHPIVVGSGQRLVREGNATSDLPLLNGYVLGADIVLLSYQPAQLEHEIASLLFENRRPPNGQSNIELALAMLGVSSDQGGIDSDDNVMRPARRESDLGPFRD